MRAGLIDPRGCRRAVNAIPPLGQTDPNDANRVVGSWRESQLFVVIALDKILWIVIVKRLVRDRVNRMGSIG